MHGMSTTGTHAPMVNFETTTTTSTMPVATAPTPLMTACRRQPGSWRRWWCLTIPYCDSVNPQNTPTA